jgi:outer membrane receptor protein involved in Fe transport
MIRFDGQLSASESGAIRWLRESSPQLNQIIPAVPALTNVTTPVTQNASREESDVDQTAVAHWASVFGNSRLNTIRLTWTQENVAFANPGFNGNGRRQDLLPPTLVYLSYEDQQSDVAQARINNAYYIDETFNWYASNHDMRFGVQLARLTQHATTQDNLNGTFYFRTNSPFNANDFSTYPERLRIRVPGEGLNNLAVKYYGLFAQDKWSITNHATLSLGVRYDLERLPIRELDNPLFSNPNDYPVDRNNIGPRLGFTYNLGSQKTTVIRVGAGRFYDKTHLELIGAVVTAGAFSTSFETNFPNNTADPGPAKGQRPADPFLANGPTVDRALLAQRFPAGSRIKNTGTVNLDSPDRTVPYADMLSIGVSRQITSGLSAAFDYVHSEGRDQFMSYDMNAGVRQGTGRSDPIVRPLSQYSGIVQVRGVNEGRTKYDAAEFQLDHHLGQSYQYRASYTYSRSRGNTSGNGIPFSNFQYQTDMRLDENEGPTDFDRPHNFVFSASWRVPHTGGLTLATVTRYLSGDPFTIQDQNIDADRNGIFFDPLPRGTYSGDPTVPNARTFYNRGGRNGARGPDFFQADARVGYDIGLAGTHVQIFGEMFNVTNRANFANPSGDRRTGKTSFLILRNLRAGGVPRTGQIGVRIAF